MITQQTNWDKKKPVRWLKLEADMLQIAKEAESKYIKLTTVNKLASAYGMAAGEVRSFLEFRNALGNFAYYSDPTLGHSYPGPTMVGCHNCKPRRCTRMPASETF